MVHVTISWYFIFLTVQQNKLLNHYKSRPMENYIYIYIYILRTLQNNYFQLIHFIILYFPPNMRGLSHTFELYWKDGIIARSMFLIRRM